MSSPVLILRRQHGSRSIFHSHELTLNPIIGVQPGCADDLQGLLEGAFLGCLRPELFEPIRRQLNFAGCCIIDADHAVSFDD
jgi:hypothetical protein